MSIPTQFLDELRVRTSLSALVQRSGVSLKKAGREWKGCCPFHQEKTPSFYVNDEKSFYHCFGCEAHGDAIRWLTDHDGMQFLDAVQQLAEAAGMEMPARDPAAAQREKARQGNVDIMERISSAYHEHLCARRPEHDQAVAVDYLRQKRNLSPSSIEKFGIGFAPASRIGDPSFVAGVARGVDAKDLEQLGLVKRNPDTHAVYDFFRRRITIPIHDARGNVIGFGGRIIGKGEPKYLNSPDTPIFDKGRTLFNLHRAAPPARAKKKMLIVEGYMDVIGLDQVGCDYAVAPNGTALTEHQMYLAWRLVDIPTVCFDGDKAGKKAAARAAYKALPIMEPGKSLRFCFPPDGKDPDDLAREGGLEAIAELENSSTSLADIIWQDVNSRFEFRDPDQRAALQAEIRSLLNTIRNQDVRAAYQSEFNDRWHAATNRAAPKRAASQPAQVPVAVAVEDSLLRGLLANQGMFRSHGPAIFGFSWRREESQALAQAIADHYADHDNVQPGDVDALIEKRGLTGFVMWLKGDATIRLPHETASDGKRSSMLLAALRENFTKGRT